MFIVNGAILFCLVIATFYASYKDSSDMKDLSRNGIWQFCYRIASTIGNILYMIETNISAFFMLPIKKSALPDKLKEALIMLFNTVLSIVTLYLITSVYDDVLGMLFPADAADSIAKYFVDNSVYRFFDSIKALLGMFVPVLSATNPIIAIQFIFYAIGKLLLFVLFHILFFSVLFGFLENKVKIFSFGGQSYVGYPEVKRAEVTALARDFKRVFISWINDLKEENPILITVANISGAIIFYIACIFGSYVFRDMLENDWSEVISIMLDALDVINIIISFVISWIMTFVLARIGRQIVIHLPEDIQVKFNKISEDLRVRERRIALKRRQWAYNYDDIYFNSYIENEYANGRVPKEFQSLPKPRTPLEHLIQTVSRYDFSNGRCTLNEREREERRRLLEERGYDYNLYMEESQYAEAVRLDRQRYDREMEQYHRDVAEYNDRENEIARAQRRLFNSKRLRRF